MNCEDCGNLVTCNRGEYFLCTGSSIKRKVVKKKYRGKTYFNIYCGYSYRACPIELEVDKDGNPLKCKKCLEAEKRMRELQEVAV